MSLSGIAFFSFLSFSCGFSIPSPDQFDNLNCQLTGTCPHLWNGVDQHSFMGPPLRRVVRSMPSGPMPNEPMSRPMPSGPMPRPMPSGPISRLIPRPMPRPIMTTEMYRIKLNVQFLPITTPF